jgi:hypothetical protein
LALSDNSYDSDVKSLSYPDDYIKWRHDLIDRDFDYANPVGMGTGHIVYRKSINQNSRDYDFRNVIFRRWNDGSGNYTVIMKSGAPNAFDFIDYKSFEEGYQTFRNNEIGSLTTLSSSFGIPYYLDNLIITTQSSAYGNYVIGHGCTIDVSSFSENKINLLLLSNIINTLSVVSYNQFDSVLLSNFYSDVTFNQSKVINSSIISGTMNGNIIVSINSSTLGELTSNKLTNIESSSIDTLTNNDINSIVSCTCSLIDYNVCNSFPAT